MNGSPSATRSESTALRILSRAVALLAGGAMALSAVGILVALVLIGWSVIMRYVFNAPPAWVDEAVGHLLVAIVMLAVGQTFRRSEHIGVDVLVDRLSPVGKRWAIAWAAVVSGAVASILIVNGWGTAMLARNFGLLTEGYLQWPVWLLMLFLPVGGALLLLATVETLWRACTDQPLSFLSHDDQAAQEEGF
jgi:TRAP-type C4-dicarboxylate transport system permease small subunit